jgi:predicted ATP-grasp superfamily ATP-dependent carboligase
MADSRGKILILDGHQRSTLAVVRSLGRIGFEVTVSEDKIPCLASRSKYASRTLRYRSAMAEPKEFINDITKELIRSKYDLLLPMTDVSMNLVVNDFDNLARLTRIPVAGKETYLNASDKGEIIKLSQELGIPIPKTFFINSISDLHEIKADLDYPVVIKPRYSKYFTSDGWISTGVDYAYSYDILVKKMERFKNLPVLPLIQERLYGPGIGVFLLLNRGVEKAVFFHRRIREKPPSGGVSVLRESTIPDPVIRDYSVRLLKELNWHGVAMVEFKVDNRDNIPRIMEINARFWGSLQLAIDSGVDFPSMLYQMITTGDVQPVFNYKIGVKSRWFMGDLDHLLMRIMKSDAQLKLPPGYPGRIRTLIEFLMFYRPKMKYEILKLNDFGPFLMEFKEWLRQLKK